MQEGLDSPTCCRHESFDWPRSVRGSQTLGAHRASWRPQETTSRQAEQCMSRNQTRLHHASHGPRLFVWVGDLSLSSPCDVGTYSQRVEDDHMHMPSQLAASHNALNMGLAPWCDTQLRTLSVTEVRAGPCSECVGWHACSLQHTKTRRSHR